MNRGLERHRDFIGSIVFVCFIIFLIVGGFFLTKYLTSDTQKKQIQKEEANKLKVDESKDFIYFENVVPISEDPEIVHKDIIINIKGNDTVNEILKSEMDNIRLSVKKISESEVDATREMLYADGDIFYSLERNYSSYESSKYFSLLVVDSEFSCYTGSTIKNVKSYNYSLSNGKQISNQTLLEYNHLTIDDVKYKINEKLNADQLEFGEENIISVEDTLNAISLDNAALYVNKTGKLVISIIVKTNQESYNDTIELN